MLELKLNASSIASFMDASSIKFAVCKEFMMLTILYIGSRDGAVVRALASHQCDLRSILGPDAICRLSLMLVLFSAREVFPRVLRFFPSPQKPTFPNSSSIRIFQWTNSHYLWRCHLNSQYIFFFIFIFHIFLIVIFLLTYCKVTRLLLYMSIMGYTWV